jgi:peptide-methionine (S)-S-oxide reductase
MTDYSLAALVLAATRRRVSRRLRHLALPLLIGIPVGRSVPAAAGAAAAAPHRAVAVLAGGCYWGVESVFDHVRGVESATSGYATPAPEAGARPAPPAEAVRLVYDPSRLSYRQILDVFFSVVHDPTQLDRQGPDVGREYRSAVFVATDSERTVVRAFIDSLSAARAFAKPIVTEIDALRSFEAVGPSQQHYAAKHPTDPYIVVNDEPKLAALRQRFPQLYRS